MSIPEDIANNHRILLIKIEGRTSLRMPDGGHTDDELRAAFFVQHPEWHIEAIERLRTINAYFEGGVHHGKMATLAMHKPVAGDIVNAGAPYEIQDGTILQAIQKMWDSNEDITSNLAIRLKAKL